MALRNILTDDEPALHKKCRIVTDFNARLHNLLDDMAETLNRADGVGLAAPQVGVIIASEGEQHEPEGCLSVPGEYGIVKRPEWVRVHAQDRYGNEFDVEGTGLTARCFCHEIDHLDGIVFTSKCERMITEEELNPTEQEE